MITRILPILLLLLLAAAFVIDRRELRTHIAKRWRCVFWLPNICLALALIYTSVGESYTMAADLWKQRLLTCTLLLGIPQTLYALLYPTRWLYVRLGASLIVLAALLYGFTLGWRQLAVVEYRYASTTLPRSFEGYRIVQLSDLHLGTLHSHEDFVEEFCDSINALKPDLIALTGDIVNYHPEELEHMTHILQRIKAHDGIVSILGNHDYLGYHHWPTTSDSIQAMEKLRTAQRGMGWHLLENEALVLRRGNDSIIVCGLENDGLTRFPSRADKELTRTVAAQPFAIFLEHDPSFFTREIAPLYNGTCSTSTGAGMQRTSLTLSGHTHAMQLRLFGWSPAAWFYPEWSGAYPRDNATLYVSQGIGSVLLPFRLGAWPEINLITLHDKP